VIESVLPAGVVAVDTVDDPPGVALLPEEEVCVAGAAPMRRREFTTVRHCARAALRQLGIAPVPIPRGQRGAPQWPAGVVGSMTHCAGYRAAAVARSRDLLSLGIDAEPHRALPPEVTEIVTLPEERVRLRHLAEGSPGLCWDRLVFSTKESVYKAWYPVTGQWLDFTDVAVTLHPQASSFSARLLVAGAGPAGRTPAEVRGRFQVTGGLLLTAAVIPTTGWAARTR